MTSTILFASKSPGEKTGETGAHTGKESRYVTSASDATIIWKGWKIIGGSHTGTMALEENVLEFVGKELVGGSFTIDMNAMTTTDLGGSSAEKLIRHLKSDDFFGVATYPTSTFVITEVKKGTEPGVYHVTGDLTIKSTTLPISFPMRMEWDENQATATASISVNRADFDVRFGSGRFFDGLGNSAISDEFLLDVSIVTNVGNID